MTNARFFEVCFLSVTAFLACFVFANFHIQIDESEHLHFAWLNHLGYRPFTDYWQHHQPLIWDLMSVPFFWLDEATSIKSLRIFFFALSITAIYLAFARFGDARLPLCLVFVFLILFPVWRWELRPETIAFPLVVFVVHYLQRNDTSQSTGGVLAITSASFLAFMLTPRAMPFTAVAAAAFLTNVYITRNMKKFWLAILVAAIWLAAFHFIYGLDTIIFFVFQQSANYEWGTTNKLVKFNTSYTLCILFVLNSCINLFHTKRDYLWLNLTNLFVVILCLIEAGPHIKQSTYFGVYLNFLLLCLTFAQLNLKVVQGYLRTAVIIFICLAINLQFVRNLKPDRLDSEVRHYLELVQQCENGEKFQGSNFLRRNKKNYTAHPIFVEDWSYFGYFFKRILNQNGVNKVVAFNKSKGRDVNYIQADGECISDGRNSRKIRKLLENAINTVERY